jgi:hypothetical protein
MKTYGGRRGIAARIINLGTRSLVAVENRTALSAISPAMSRLDAVSSCQYLSVAWLCCP